MLRQHGLEDPERAARELRAIGPDEQARSVLARLLPALLPALSAVPDPDAALARLERFVHASGGGAGVLAVLHERGAESVGLLALALGASPFLADVLIRHPEWAGGLTDHHALGRARSAQDFAAGVREALAEAGPGGARDVLRRVRRREILRLALRDLRRLVPVEETLGGLSALADALVSGAFDVAATEVRAEAGLPPRRSGARAGLAVLALGKLGGSELNFSSDVDLVYLHRTDVGVISRRSEASSRHAHADALGRRLTAVLGEASHEGHVYRVDLRLRPEGGAGSISHSLRAAEEYYLARGAAWERLALIKARPVAGDTELARELLRRVAPFVWERVFDAPSLAQVLRMKHDSDRRLAARGLADRHVKLGRGGIREIELITQVLQLRSGGRGALRSRATLPALAALREAGALPAPEGRHAGAGLPVPAGRREQAADGARRADAPPALGRPRAAPARAAARLFGWGGRPGGGPLPERPPRPHRFGAPAVRGPAGATPHRRKRSLKKVSTAVRWRSRSPRKARPASRQSSPW